MRGEGGGGLWWVWGGGGWGGGGVEIGVSTVHFPLGQSTFHANFFFVFGGVIKAKSSQQHLTSIPFALASVVLLSPVYMGSKGTLQFKIEPSILGCLHSFMFLTDDPIKLAHCEKNKK